MSKAAIASLVAEKFDLSKAKADQIVAAVFSGITSSLVSQGAFSYVGFGRLQVVERAPRPGRNPLTGEKLQIAARRTVKFTVGEKLKRELNTQERKGGSKRSSSKRADR